MLHMRVKERETETDRQCSAMQHSAVYCIQCDNFVVRLLDDSRNPQQNVNIDVKFAFSTPNIGSMFRASS